MLNPFFWATPTHSLSKTDKLDDETLPSHESTAPYDYGVAMRHSLPSASRARSDALPTRRPAPDQSVERRSSGALSDFAGSDLVSDLSRSILALSTRGVSTRADTPACDASAERVCSGGCRERGRATARAISI